MAWLLSGSVKPGIMNAMGRLPGTSPFKRIALSAIEANNIGKQVRDVSMMGSPEASDKLKDELSSLDVRTYVRTCIRTYIRTYVRTPPMKQRLVNAVSTRIDMPMHFLPNVHETLITYVRTYVRMHVRTYVRNQW